ncbi:hypothetical protein M9H77_26565 [Catharanthus roseus]|uniref:Uncharacterized protein n=1 Tax=Catharanthus roseus TaxID=4058 RepID=A0ACC0ABF5_CATRO|nr:hypothetical protein M9H77_26565 [Catharanthus roseus]
MESTLIVKLAQGCTGMSLQGHFQDSAHSERGNYQQHHNVQYQMLIWTLLSTLAFSIMCGYNFTTINSQDGIDGLLFHPIRFFWNYQHLLILIQVVDIFIPPDVLISQVLPSIKCSKFFDLGYSSSIRDGIYVFLYLVFQTSNKLLGFFFWKCPS